MEESILAFRSWYAVALPKLLVILSQSRPQNHSLPRTQISSNNVRNAENGRIRFRSLPSFRSLAYRQWNLLGSSRTLRARNLKQASQNSSSVTRPGLFSHIHASHSETRHPVRPRAQPPAERTTPTLRHGRGGEIIASSFLTSRGFDPVCPHERCGGLRTPEEPNNSWIPGRCQRFGIHLLLSTFRPLEEYFPVQGGAGGCASRSSSPARRRIPKSR